MFHYYDPDARTWRSLQNPSADEIAAILAAAATRRPCESCDADVEFLFGGDGPPDIVVTHADDCPRRAA